MIFFISVEKTVESVIIALFLGALVAGASLRAAGALQALGYSCKRHAEWLARRGNMQLKRLFSFAVLATLSSAVIALAFAFTGVWAAVISLAPMALFFCLYIYYDNKTALKVPASFTPRFKRLIAVLFTLSAIVAYIFIALLNMADYLWGEKIFGAMRYCPLGLAPLLVYPIIWLSNLVACAYEVPANRRYIKKAKAKIAASKIKTVAITGSYGKTGVKFILSNLLSQKFSVLATPRSYNTPKGIAVTVNSDDLSKYDIFIAEMGARHVGDIAELCKICPPDIGVITGVCAQHIQTFGSFANVVAAKGEILAAADKAVIADDCYDLYAEYGCEKVRACGASNIVCSADGVEFDLTIDGKTARVKSCLLGEHSAKNIAVAAQTAYMCGVEFEKIVEAIPSVPPVEHRLQLIKKDGVNILDDGYNSNVVGARAALKVLKMFEGAKICVTPGLIELGVLEESENYSLGKQLVGLDMVILVGDTLVQAVARGYIAAGGDKQKIYTAPTLAEAQKLFAGRLKAGDAVLFLNDLPDIY